LEKTRRRPDPSRIACCSWLPSGASSKNFESEFVLDLEAFRKRRTLRELKVPPVVGHLELAERFQALLDSGEAPTGPGWHATTG
jgi:hypothetical protein